MKPAKNWLRKSKRMREMIKASNIRTMAVVDRNTYKRLIDKLKGVPFSAWVRGKIEEELEGDGK